MRVEGAGFRVKDRPGAGVLKVLSRFPKNSGQSSSGEWRPVNVFSDGIYLVEGSGDS